MPRHVLAVSAPEAFTAASTVGASVVSTAASAMVVSVITASIAASVSERPWLSASAWVWPQVIRITAMRLTTAVWCRAGSGRRTAGACGGSIYAATATGDGR